MPLTKTPETNIIFDPNAKFEMPEHTGGDGWTILHGDCLRLMREMQDGVFDAVITDPPYASGGSTPAEKNKTTNQKYSSMSADKAPARLRRRPDGPAQLDELHDRLAQ